MILKELFLTNFRVHKNTKMSFSDGINYIVGGNGQGKTSILEAIYYLCTTKNFKSSTDLEILRFNEEDYEITGLFEDLTKDSLRVYFNKNEKRRVYLQNNKQIHRASDVIGKYPLVLLTPEDHSLTQGAPSERRRFVDSILSQAKRSYLDAFLDYNRVLKQRSGLLSLIQQNYSRALLVQLDAWDERLVESGLLIINLRCEFVKLFNRFVAESYSKIMFNSEVPHIEYSTFGDDPTLINREYFQQKLTSKRDEEIRRSSNLVGPHRDDFIFKINKKSLKTYGSQGQHKTFQVALRFAQYFYLKENSGRNPLFLLDDVFGELDSMRAQRISEYLREVGQTFITLTDFANHSFLHRTENDMFISVSNGNVSYV